MQKVTKLRIIENKKKKRARRKKWLLKRALTRKTRFEPISNEHLKWLWLAYKENSFQEEIVKPGLGRDEFIAAIMQILPHSVATFILFAPFTGVIKGKEFKGEAIPVGIVTNNMFAFRTSPHVDWFAWATPRNKLEATLRYLAKVRKDGVHMILTSEPDTPFFTHFAMYGIINRVGKVDGYYLDLTDAMLFQTTPIKDL